MNELNWSPFTPYENNPRWKADRADDTYYIVVKIKDCWHAIHFTTRITDDGWGIHITSTADTPEKAKAIAQKHCTKDLRRKAWAEYMDTHDPPGVDGANHHGDTE